MASTIGDAQQGRGTATGFGVRGEADVAGAHKAQDSIRLTDFNGKPVAGANPGFKPLAAPETWPTEQFFTVFGDLLKDTPTPPAAQPLVARLSAIGLTPKSGYTPSSLSKETLAAIDAGAKDGFAAIQAAKLGDSANGWDFSMKNGRFGEDYLVRSAIAFRSLAGNAPEEAIYFNADKDVAGQPLDGANRYSPFSQLMSDIATPAFGPRRQPQGLPQWFAKRQPDQPRADGGSRQDLPFTHRLANGLKWVESGHARGVRKGTPYGCTDRKLHRNMSRREIQMSRSSC